MKSNSKINVIFVFIRLTNLTSNFKFFLLLQNNIRYVYKNLFSNISFLYGRVNRLAATIKPSIFQTKITFINSKITKTRVKFFYFYCLWLADDFIYVYDIRTIWTPTRKNKPPMPDWPWASGFESWAISLCSKS